MTGPHITRHRTVAGAASAVLVAAAVVGVAPAATALTAPVPLLVAGSSDDGVLVSTTPGVDVAGGLELVDADGATTWSAPLPVEDVADGPSTAHELSYCADTATALYPDAIGDRRVVRWWSVPGSASGRTTLEGLFLASAPDGWVSLVGRELLLYGTDGSSRSLGTLPSARLGATVCDESAILVEIDETSLVRVPFDGSGPVTVRTVPRGEKVVQALAIDGDVTLAASTRDDGIPDDGPFTVERIEGTTVTDVLSPGTDQGVQAAAVLGDATLVCLTRRDHRPGCEAHLVTPSGTTTTALPETSFLAPSGSGATFLDCSSVYDECLGLGRVAAGDLVSDTLYRAGSPLMLRRWSGDNRYEVAAEVAEETAVRYGPGTMTMYLAAGHAFADSLSVGSPGALADRPLLLTGRRRLPDATRSQIRREKPSEVVVVGGTASVSEAVVDAVEALGPRVRRIGGATRYEVAAGVSEADWRTGARTVFVVSGEVFPDGLVAAPAAAQHRAPILLTRSGALPRATRAEIRRLRPESIVVIGGPASVGPAVMDALRGLVDDRANVRRVSGANRYELSATVAREVVAATAAPGAVGADVLLATGRTFPDALALGPASRGYRPILLTPASGLGDVAARSLQELAPRSVSIAGGPASVAEDTEERILDLPDVP